MLEEKIKKLEELCRKKDKFLQASVGTRPKTKWQNACSVSNTLFSKLFLHSHFQSTKMILKFRDAHIAKLEKSQKKNDCVITAGERDKEIVRFTVSQHTIPRLRI